MSDIDEHPIETLVYTSRYARELLERRDRMRRTQEWFSRSFKHGPSSDSDNQDPSFAGADGTP